VSEHFVMTPSCAPPFLMTPSKDGNASSMPSPHRTSKHDGEAKNMWQDSTWYSIDCAALLESDTAESLALIKSAQRAIQDHVAELNVVSAGNAHERQALSEALDDLGILLEKGSESETTLWD